MSRLWMSTHSSAYSRTTQIALGWSLFFVPFVTASGQDTTEDLRDHLPDHRPQPDRDQSFLRLLKTSTSLRKR